MNTSGSNNLVQRPAFTTAKNVKFSLLCIEY